MEKHYGWVWGFPFHYLLQLHLMANEHNHSHCELLRNSDLPDSGKKLEHMEDESDVMASLLLSVKDGIKIGWNTAIVPLRHLNPPTNRQTVVQHAD